MSHSLQEYFTFCCFQINVVSTNYNPNAHHTNVSLLDEDIMYQVA